MDEDRTGPQAGRRALTVGVLVAGLAVLGIDGDDAFQLVVSSRSGDRATDLSRHIIPTFAPR